MHKLIALGQDNIIHCCDVNNKTLSCCEGKITIKQVNIELYKINPITWCYECSDLLERQDAYYATI